MRTGADMSDPVEYEGGILAGIDRYISTFEEPFIKGLLKGKGGKHFDWLMHFDNKQNKVVFWMEALMNDFNTNFRGVPIYLYLKKERRRNKLPAYSLIWRVSRQQVGTSNTMISLLFSEGGGNDYILSRFGPAMKKKLREYDEYRLSLNIAESQVRHQRRTASTFLKATNLVED